MKALDGLAITVLPFSQNEQREEALLDQVEATDHAVEVDEELKHALGGLAYCLHGLDQEKFLREGAIGAQEHLQNQRFHKYGHVTFADLPVELHAQQENLQTPHENFEFLILCILVQNIQVHFIAHHSREIILMALKHFLFQHHLENVKNERFLFRVLLFCLCDVVRDMHEVI